jgi:hypothetical protein
LSFLVELGAAIKVAFTTVPVLSISPRSIQVGEFEVAIGGGIWVAIREQVPKAKDGALVGQPGDTRIELGKPTVQRDVMQGLFHGRIAQSKPLLHKVNGSMLDKGNAGLPVLLTGA